MKPRRQCFSRALWLVVLGTICSPALGAGFGDSASKTELELTFGLYTSDKATDMVRKLKPVLKVLERSLEAELGVAVAIGMKVAASYEDGVRMIADGQVDFARLGPASYVLASEADPDLRILAMEKSKEGTTFFGVICVHRDSPITKVEELEHKSFAFGADSSTIGRYLSQAYLVDHGITASDLSDHAYLGRHDKVGALVALGRYDAGALKESTFNKLVAAGEPLREIARFPNVTKPWVARSSLPEAHGAALERVLLSLQDADALAALGKKGFLPAEDGAYAMIRNAIATNSRFFAGEGGGGM